MNADQDKILRDTYNSATEARDNTRRIEGALWPETVRSWFLEFGKQIETETEPGDTRLHRIAGQIIRGERSVNQTRNSIKNLPD